MQYADQFVTRIFTPDAFPLVRGGKVADLFVHRQDYWGVQRAAGDLQQDLLKVSGTRPEMGSDVHNLGTNAVLIGTLGKSPVIGSLVEAGKLQAASRIKGLWEAFLIQVVEEPLPGMKRALVIAGSDMRGTIFGIYELSRQCGVSPWYYWADVPPHPSDTLAVLPGCYMEGESSVKYRGIFLNDEAPALTGWVHATFGNYTHEFYVTVFELLLRLKANFLWPAMWNNAFNDDDPLNPELANKYGIVMGTSHHEPLMRACKEWERKGSGAWDYASNGEALYKFWDKGMQRNAPYENIVTLGMRGDGDEPMPGETIEDKIRLLRRIITDQREIIAKHVNKDITTVPQLWAIYKEVQEFYMAGMRVPEDITLLWSDDNFGNIRRLPTEEERTRSGGAGIYYHVDYVGGPISYKWVNTVPLPKIWEQMSMAWDYDARRVWMLNVGDLKPMEFPISFFLSLARNVKQWNRDNLDRFALNWAAEQFGEEFAAPAAEVLLAYARLNGRRKPAVITNSTYSQVHYREAERVLAEWETVVKTAEDAYARIPAGRRDAFFQLVLYPARASKRVTEMHYYGGLNNLYHAQERSLTNAIAAKVREVFAAEEEDTRYYNEAMAAGKWRHMMDQPHIGARTWDGPEENVLPEIFAYDPPLRAAMGVAVEGSEQSWPGNGDCRLPGFNVFIKESHYLEIFNKGQTSFAFTAHTGHPWILLSRLEGIVRDQERLTVDIDWDKAPLANEIRGEVVISREGGERVTVLVTVNNPPQPRPEHVEGFVETNGYICMEADHYTRRTALEGVAWERIPSYGLTGSSMAVFPATAASILPPAPAPCLEYKFYLFNPGLLKLTTYTAPSLNVNPAHGLRLALACDDGEAVIIDTFRVDQDGFYTDPEWSDAVMDNVCRKEINLQVEKPGYHVLKISMVDPGLVLQKIVIDTGGLLPSYLGPPESFHAPVTG